MDSNWPYLVAGVILAAIFITFYKWWSSDHGPNVPPAPPGSGPNNGPKSKPYPKIPGDDWNGRQ